MSEVATSESDAELIARLRRENAALSESNAALNAELNDAKQSLARLRTAYNKALEELHLLKHRLFVAKAERRDTTQEQLAFDNIERTVKALADQLQDAEDDSSEEPGTSSDETRKQRKRSARRAVSESDLPIKRVELRDDSLEKTSEFIGFETTWKLGYERGGARRIQIDRAVYKTAEAGPTAEEPAQFETTAMPKEIVGRGILAPSMIAHVLTQKFMMGLPFYRQEKQFAQIGCPLDRGTMSRYAEEIGATLGNIVLAMSEDAKKTAFCLSTDATGVSIQLGPLQERERGPCRKGHFFIVLADREHVFFEYQAKHTSAAVCEMFRGYQGYLQADAHAIYDALFLGAASGDAPAPKEVGCWSHVRRKFWEAAVCKHTLGVEGRAL
ncbi:MAG: transposase [Polyangiales bacterium]